MKAPKIITAAEHGIDAKQLCSSATEVVEMLQQAGHEAYIVGGSVRDLVLGMIPKDFDVATDATPEQVRSVFPRCRLIGRRFRLAHVRLRGVLVEVATFRGQDERNDNKHVHADGRILRDNVWGSLEEDAVRRDFTINALFLDPVSGEIKDFVGGYEDLKDMRLRLIGDPETRYREDPVRLLRAARFIAKLEVAMDPGTRAPVREMAAGLGRIPPARLFEEVLKLFLTGHATRSLEALQELGLTRALFPVLKKGGNAGEARLDPLLERALVNTDLRVAEDKSVTPAFLFAALLWQPVQHRAERFRGRDATEFQAMESAADEVLALQVKRTAIPRRFSSVTRQIWLNQVRLGRTRGKRALRILHQPRFRAAYDFLLLRAEDDSDLEPLVEFWRDAQRKVDVTRAPQPGKRRRGRRRRPRARKAATQSG